jgi:adenylate cyclase
MRRGTWAALLGLVVGLLGAAAWLSPAGPFLENIGLEWLFAVRGPVDAPQDVVIVSIDRASADRLGLPPDPEKWPRSLHADLIDKLVQRGAAAIVLDIWFEDRSDDDTALKDAIERSERVVLFASMERDGTLESPIREIADAATGLAPWVVPAGTVRYVWSFLTPNQIPTLPVVALQVRTFPHRETFAALLKQAGIQAPKSLSIERGDWTAKKTATLMQELRDALRNKKNVYATILKRIRNNALTGSSMEDETRLLLALLKVYVGEDRFYLNYYGPAGAIETIPYVEVYRGAFAADTASEEDLRGKVIFVGAVGLSTPGAQDHYDTVYTSQLSGVEIAATAYANFLTDRPIVPLSDAAATGIMFAYGLLLGAVAYLLRGNYAAATIAAFGGAYFGVAMYLFAAHAVWMPVLIPTTFQLPAGMYLGLFWRYRHISTTYAVCLSTDIENSTALWERMTRAKRELELRATVTDYFSMIDRIVRRSKGKVSHSGDDSTMNFWDAPHEDQNTRLNACLAAIKMARAVEHFNRERGNTRLPTRFGLDAGQVTITTTGNGRRESYEEGEGDAFNSAKRIEELNKELGTKVLASEAVVTDLGGVLLRPVGIFLVRGKSEPLSIFEIMCQEQDAKPADRDLCERFAVALQAYKLNQWSEAITLFESLKSSYRGDRPSKFYVELCEKYRDHGAPPEHPAIKVEELPAIKEEHLAI